MTHCPELLQDWASSPLHWVEPLTHEPQEPELQALGHVCVNCHVPDESQVSTFWPEHFFAVGTHEPMQLPPLHTYGHVCAVCQKPLLLHV